MLEQKRLNLQKGTPRKRKSERIKSCQQMRKKFLNILESYEPS